MTAVSNYVIRAMFLTRVYRLSKKNLWVVGGILALSTADLVITLTISIKAFNFSSFVELNNISALIYTSFGSGTGADLCLALVLLYLLYRSRTGFKKTNSLIRVLMMYTVNTGMIVAVDAALGVIAYAAMPHNFIFLGFYLLSSKLYVNAYIAMLNARKSLRNDRDELISFKLTNVTSNPIAASPFRQRDTKATMVEEGSRADTGKTAVTITTLVEQHHDQDAASV
ncbi:hypothetical protein BJ165DRAFT_744186 [Panaeolus papilionaceus]|nr:hypothetical protein BJ165DRAFT_744186 [Panaeolus papilionaceus]